MLGVLQWLWATSPRATLIHVDSGAELVLRIKDAIRPHRPVDPTPFLSFAVAITAIGGLARIARGLA